MTQPKKKSTPEQDKPEQEVKGKRTRHNNPADGALYRRLIPARNSRGKPRSIRIGVYPSSDPDKPGNVVSIGIGDDNPYHFARIAAYMEYVDLATLIEALQEAWQIR